MAVYRTNCPHCNTSNVAFDSVQEWSLKNDTNRRALFICGNCREGIIVAFLKGMMSLSQAHNVEDARIHIQRVWPAAQSSDAPQATPERAARYFKQATEGMAIGHFDAAGSMYRKCLESATKVLGQSDKLPLIQRIDALASASLITPEMRVWAHQIRLGGNAAVHEDEPFDRAAATALSAFCDAFLRYAFTLPAMVVSGSNPEQTD